MHESSELTLLKLAASVELPIPSMNTGRSVYFLASSSLLSNIAEAPLQIYEQSSNFIGSTSFLEFMTSSTDTFFLNRAL